MRWVTKRSDLGFLWYEGWDLTKRLDDTKVVEIRRRDKSQKKWVVQVLDHVPFHKRTLRSAKQDGEYVYNATLR
jgi:hypothetical protein